MDKNYLKVIKHLNKFKQTLRVMKIATFFLFFGILFSQAENSFSQEITLRMESSSIREICKELERKCDYIFVFSKNSEKTINKQVKVDIVSKNIREILDYLLVEYELNYKVFDKQIVVYGKNESVATTQQPPKKITISGSVTDDLGETLPEVNIYLKSDKAFGTTTDKDGSFVITVPLKDDLLVFSFIGMQNSEIKISDKTPTILKVVLKPSDTELGEVVITGFGEIDARKKTSAITSLKMDDILMPGMTTIDEALEGRVPDMIFMQNSGEVGATARLRIRGTSTLIGNREPLWVLDGMPLSDPVDVSVEQLNDPDYINYIGNAISGINPQDIERIDILKDAAATALYGTRAANGVIVVTSKKGHIGKPTFSYSTQLKTIVRPRYTDRNINLMNSQERMLFGKDLIDLHYAFPTDMTLVGYEGAYDRYVKGQTNYNQFLDEVSYYETVNTDLFDVLTNDALTQSHTLSLSGGDEKTRYYSSFGYTGEDAIVRSQLNDRYTVAMSLQTNISESLRASIRVNGGVAKKDYLPSEIDPLKYAYNTTRALPVYNPDGSYYYYKRHAYNVGTEKTSDYYKYNYNIFNEMENASNKHNSNNIIAAFDLMYRYKTILDFSLTASYQRTSSTTETWFGEKTNYVAHLKNAEIDEEPIPGTAGKVDLPYGGVLNSNNNITEDLTARFQVNFHEGFGDNKIHLINSSLGYEVSSYTNDGYSDKTRGYYKDRGMKYFSTGSAEDIAKYPAYANWMAQNHREMTAMKTNKISGYMTLSYSYGDYFTLNTNGRFDASNKFGSRSNEKFLPIWSASGMVNLKRILLNDFEVADDIRLRASYGKTGNMVDGQTPNLLLRQGGLNDYYGEYYSTVYAFPNPNLRWEQTDQVNIGLETSFLNRRLMFSTDFYYKSTHDAFVTVPVSTTNGMSQYVMNGGDITNRGFSFSVSGYPIRKTDWTWYLSTNYSLVKNKIDSDIVNEYGINEYLSGTAIVSGQPISSFYSYQFLGLDPKNGMPMFDDYEDRRHLLEDKKLEEIVQMVMVNNGTRDPKFTGSLYSTLTYKQLSMNLNFTYSLGNRIRMFDLYSEILQGVSSENNVRKEFIDRWMLPGDELTTNIPALLSPGDPLYRKYSTHWSNKFSADLQGFKSFATNVWNMYDNSDIRTASGSYLRLSSVTFRYQVKPSKLINTPFNNVSFDLSGNNLFTICSKKLKGQDPSQSGFGASKVLSIRPAYTFGFRVSF